MGAADAEDSWRVCLEVAAIGIEIAATDDGRNHGREACHQGLVLEVEAGEMMEETQACQEGPHLEVVEDGIGTVAWLTCLAGLGLEVEVVVVVVEWEGENLRQGGLQDVGSEAQHGRGEV